MDMTIVFEERLSDSPYVESITHGWTVSDGAPTRPAEISWHMVFSKHNGRIHPIVVGPLTSSGEVTYGAGAEILWIKFKLGTFMPHLPTRKMLNSETMLPDARSDAFWLNGSAWQIPDFENVDTFINRLVRDDILVCDPVVSAALQDHPQALSPRTLRHRFLNSTGLTQSHIRQFERAKHAAELLANGTPILDVVYEAGYYDQPHLTRSLKHFMGYTPAQQLSQLQPE
ncbi:MAG: helix-turn-helix domain-containing protein [Aggregatilineales bacterium]